MAQSYNTQTLLYKLPPSPAFSSYHHLKAALPRRTISRRTIPASSTSTLPRRAQGVIQPQRTVVNLLPIQHLRGLNRRLHIREIRVRESSRLSRAAINSNTDVDDVGDVAEQLVQVCVGHLEGEVADEEGLGGGVLGLDDRAGLGHVVYDQAAAFEDGLVALLDGVAGGFDVFEFDVAESVGVLACAPYFIYSHV